MATIDGPEVQVPSPDRMVREDGRLHQEWQTFFHGAQQVVFNGSRSGPTASRPTSKMDGRWIGMQFFDTTLGIMIWLKSTNPDVWVRYDGTPV